MLIIGLEKGEGCKQTALSGTCIITYFYPSLHPPWELTPQMYVPYVHYDVSHNVIDSESEVIIMLWKHCRQVAVTDWLPVASSDNLKSFSQARSLMKVQCFNCDISAFIHNCGRLIVHDWRNPVVAPFLSLFTYWSHCPSSTNASTRCDISVRHTVCASFPGLPAANNAHYFPPEWGWPRVGVLPASYAPCGMCAMVDLNNPPLGRSLTRCYHIAWGNLCHEPIWHGWATCTLIWFPSSASYLLSSRFTDIF